MLIPFDLIAAMLFLGYYAARPDPSPPAVAQAAAVVAGFAAVLAMLAVLVNRVALWHIRSGGRSFAERRFVAVAADGLMRVLLVLGYASALSLSAFPWSLARRFGWSPAGSFGIQLCALFLYALFFISVWIPLFGLHRETSPGTWTRWSFLVHKARYNLVLLVVWIPFALFSEWVSDALVVLPFLLFAAAWTFPRVLAKLWGCKPLEDRKLLSLIHGLESRAGAKFSKAYIWEPGGGRMQNAAAVGILPPFRYLFLTPALIANMRKDELEAVILHELGHIKKLHLLFYTVTTLAGVNLAAVAGELLPLTGDLERFAVSVILVLCYFRFVFGWMSRNMERQADLFSLAAMGTSTSIANALEKLGISAGNVRNARSWHHLGIAERVKFLRIAERDPELVKWHEAGVSRIMFAGYALSFATLIILGAALFQAAGEGAVPARPPEREIAHWRRVMQLLPECATGRLELAYRLAAAPSSREEARRLAAEAARLSGMSEERQAAEKLLRELSGDGQWEN